MAHLTLDGVACATPDGTLLFSDLNLAVDREIVGLFGRNGSGKSTLLDVIAGRAHAAAGTITCDGKVGLLRQLPEVACGTVGELLGIADDLARLSRIEAGAGSEADLAQADWSLPARAESLLATFGLAVPLDRPVESLSGGERTRLMLAGLLLPEPDILLLDEPTNNLDEDGRRAVADLLERWNGPALVASHDRQLLEHADRIVELSSARVQIIGGGWSAFEAQREAERQRALGALEKAKAGVRTARREKQRETEKQARRDKHGRAVAAKGIDPKIYLHAQQQRAERTSARYRATGDDLISRAEDMLARAEADVEQVVPIRIALPASALPQRHILVSARQLVCDRGGRRLFGPLDLTIRGPERILLTGPNGAGKTSLIRLILGLEEPSAGEIAADRSAIALLDQHLAVLDPRERAVEAMRRLNPAMSRADAHAALAAFGFRNLWADRTVATLSGGEKVRLALACLFSRPEPPQMLILDEPTNHLDVHAIELLETALVGYDGAILCVTHDPVFARSLGLERRLELP